MSIEKDTMTTSKWILVDGSLIHDSNDANHDYDDTDKLKVSPNGKYAAVYGVSGMYADFYTTYDDGYCKYLYSLRKNGYRTENSQFILEFFEHPEDSSRTLFVFNLNHGELAVCDAESGKELHTDDSQDKFITSMKVIESEGEQYLFVEGWYWTPIFFNALYKVKSLLTCPDYESAIIATGFDYPVKHPTFRLIENDEFGFRIEAKPWFDGAERKVYSLADFEKNHKDYFDEWKDWEFTKLITSNKNNFLHLLCSKTFPSVVFNGDAKTVLSYILDDDNERIHCNCVGGRTGNQLKHNVEYVANPITNKELWNEELNYLFPQLLFKGFGKNVKVHDLPSITLTFTFKKCDRELKMTVLQNMKCAEKHTWVIDPDEDCHITFDV